VGTPSEKIKRNYKQEEKNRILKAPNKLD